MWQQYSLDLHAHLSTRSTCRKLNLSHIYDARKCLSNRYTVSYFQNILFGLNVGHVAWSLRVRLVSSEHGRPKEGKGPLQSLDFENCLILCVHE